MTPLRELQLQWKDLGFVLTEYITDNVLPKNKNSGSTNQEAQKKQHKKQLWSTHRSIYKKCSAKEETSRGKNELQRREAWHTCVVVIVVVVVVVVA